MTKRIIDLTLEISNNMPSHKDFQRPVYLQSMTHDKSIEMGLGTKEDPLTSASNYIGMIEHIGTHVDSYYHVNPNGETIDRMPLDLFFGKAICFDLTHIPDLGEIDVEDLEEAEEKTGIKVDGHIVLLNTGFHKRHYPNPDVCYNNPGLTAAATHWLADRGSKAHGVEGPSADLPNNSFYPNHRVCRDRGIFHYEWLVNLEELVGKGEFMFYGMPLKFKGGSGSPVRAYAIIEE